MRISDWSSDVCSSDLDLPDQCKPAWEMQTKPNVWGSSDRADRTDFLSLNRAPAAIVTEYTRSSVPDEIKEAIRRGVRSAGDRKSVGSGKCVAVRVDLGGRRILKKNKTLI